MSRSTSWLLFGCWAIAGGCLVLGFLTIFTIGIALLPISLVAVGFLLWRKQSRNSPAWGLLAGGALPLIYVGGLNRGGPGTVCTTTALAESCVDEWSPWPWVIAGLISAAVGLGAFAVLSRREPSEVAVQPAVDLHR